MPPSDNNDIVLTNGQFALLRDNTKGVVYALVGPMVHTRSGASETPVLYDPRSRTFVEVDVRGAMQQFVTAKRNQYVVLANPAASRNNAHPNTGSKQVAQDLQVGETEIIAGPCTFALWPGQSAEVIDGHSLHYNEYLLIQVIDEEAARRNWKKSVFKKTDAPVPTTRTELVAEGGVVPPDAKTAEVPAPVASLVTDGVPTDLFVGQQFLVKGSEVRFYMPSTGVTVVRDESGNFVRQALSLEILDYCILLDEDGTKTFPRGPCVVFPTPTQSFVTSPDGTRVFRPIELNDIQGLHLKSLRAHDFLGKHYEEGEEFFLTGKECRLYYPSPLHAAVKYDGKAQHYAVCIPEGDTRYMLDRMAGRVSLVKGPVMLLPNAVTEVIVRRVLTTRQCALWYPGNEEAAQYNAELRKQQASTPTTRVGVSDGQVERNATKGGVVSTTLGGDVMRGMATSRQSAVMESSAVSKAQKMIGEEVSRSSTYNAPRTVTLSDKYNGAPVIMPWPGYAALVIGKDGTSRVITSGERYALEFHEDLQSFVYSTGRPKSAKNRKSDVYLRTANNAVRDEITVITKDHVPVVVYISLRVGFEGTTQEEMKKWWSVEDYVQFLTHHVRSKCQAAIRKLTLTQFYATPAEHIRDIVLGTGTVNEHGKAGKRPGLFFEDNRLRVYDVDVLEVSIKSEAVQAQISKTAVEVVLTELGLAQAVTATEAKGKLAALALTEIELDEKVAQAKHVAKIEAARREAQVTKGTLEVEEMKKDWSRDQRTEDFRLEQSMKEAARVFEMRMAVEQLEFNVKAHAEDVGYTKAKTEIDVDAFERRFKAVDGKIAEAIIGLSDKRLLSDLAQATAVQRVVGNQNVGSVVKAMLGDELSRGFDAAVARVSNAKTDE